MENQEVIPGFVIYTGMFKSSRTGISHTYLSINLTDNTGQSIFNLEPRRLSFDTKLFNGRPGSIFAVEFKGDKSILYNKKSIPSGFWANDNDVTEWQTTTDAIDLLLKKSKKDAALISQNLFKQSLDPIKRSYKNGSSSERAAILANIINYLNS